MAREQATVLSPIRRGAVIDLGNSLFRKQLLPFGSIDYKGRKIHFTREYATTLVDAFRRRAYDAVKLIMAPGDNSHTEDPERMRGSVVALELANDGLDMLVQPDSEETAELIRRHPDLGVSARIVEDLQRADGKRFGAAVKHVLMTLDPRVTGLRPWTAVDLAVPEGGKGTVVDLTELQYDQQQPLNGGPMPESTADQAERFAQFRAWEAQQQPADDPPEQTRPDPGPDPAPDPATPDEDDTDEPTAEEIQAAIALLESQQAAGAELTAEAQAAIDLANSTAEDAQRRARALEVELARTRFAGERHQLILDGVPPNLIDLAAPILERPEAHTIDLANGPVDVAEVLRKMLDGARGYIDLARARGYVDETDQAADRAADEALARQLDLD